MKCKLVECVSILFVKETFDLVHHTKFIAVSDISTHHADR